MFGYSCSISENIITTDLHTYISKMHLHYRHVRDVVSMSEAFASDSELQSRQCESSGYNPILGTLLVLSATINILGLVVMLRVPLIRGVVFNVLRNIYRNTSYAIRSFAFRDFESERQDSNEADEVVTPVVDLLGIRDSQAEAEHRILPYQSDYAQAEGSSVRECLQVDTQSTSNCTSCVGTDFIGHPVDKMT